MTEKKTVAIIHFNTPELTEAAIKSIRKHGGEAYRVVVFDNSDTRPFEKPMRGVEVIDNTKGQIIDFDAELGKYPERDRTIGCAKGCEFGSAKHMMTVQKLWELLPDGFVLMESDILLKRDIEEFFAPQYSVYGYWQKSQPNNPFYIGRMLPMLCWINVPMLAKAGAKYFDPERTYGLLPGGRCNRNNWYDTGSVLLEDIIKNRPHLKGYHRDIREFVEHYGSGSWANNDLWQQTAWLEKYRDLWQTDETSTVAICAIGRLENRYAVEWVEHYKQLGVAHIYIYDNNREGEEHFEDVLKTYIDEGFVSVHPFTGSQKKAYEQCYNDFNSAYDWIGFFDFDEFVEIQDGRKAADLLSGFDYADVVVLNWRTMTDNGLLHYEDKPVKERFTEGTGEDFQINRHVKSFVQTGISGISFNDPHCPNAPKLKVVNVHGISVKQVPIQEQVIHDIARIDHYDTKTAEEWINKNRRGWPDATKEIADRRRASAIDIFFAINQRTKEKEEILSVLKTEERGKAAIKREQSDTCISSAEREQANRRVSDGKPKTKKSTNKKGKKI